jgi:hypothetical protein
MSNEVGGFDPVGPPSSPPNGSPPAYAQPLVPSVPPAHPNPAPGYPPPSYYSPGYPQPGYPGYPPPGYAHGYPQAPYPYPQAPYPPPGYGYPPQSYPGAVAAALKPGIIPLRPLTLSEIFNGAIAYVRMNPKATLGMTAIVVIASQVIGLALQIWPLAALGALNPSTFDPLSGSQPSDEALVGSMLSSLAGVTATGLASIVLSGLLTVIVGRAVFGSKITAGEAWQRARGRLLPLFGLTVLQAVGITLLIVVAVVLTVLADYVAGVAAAVIVGILAFVLVVVLMLYVSTVLVFAPALVVLEQLGIVPAIARSFALVRKDFWRVLGIWVLAMIVAYLITMAVTAPFSIVGEVLLMTSESTTRLVIALVLIGIGGAIGQIITAPFSAGVVVLLYTDRRMRAEAFDLVLQTGATAPTDAPADSTDHLWLTARS